MIAAAIERTALSTEAAIIELANYLADVLYAASLKHIIDSGSEIDLKVTIRRNCGAHGYATCLHISDCGFGTLDHARRYLRRQREDVVFPDPEEIAEAA